MKFYLLTPQCPPNPHLFPQWVPFWKSKGIEIVDRIEDCDVVLFDLHVRQFDYGQRDIDWLCQYGKNVSIFCEWDRGQLSLDIYPNPLTRQQKEVFGLIKDGRLHSVEFCRLLDKRLPIASLVHPYEKNILYEEAITTYDEIFNREYDIVYIANTAPSREKIAEALRKDGRLNCHISLGNPKLPFDEFLSMHKRGKFFINSGAGGYTCERPQLLFSISGMIREETNQLLLHPFTHVENCLKINNPPTTEDLDTIFEYCNNKEKLYNLYLRQNEFMRTYYSADYIAEDILNKIIEHCA